MDKTDEVVKPQSRAELRAILLDIVADQLAMTDEKKAEVKDDSDLVAGLGADSLDVVETLSTTEEKLGIEIPDEDTRKIKTFGDFVNTVAKILGL